MKFGWEVPLPPRTPERAVTNPPQAFLELLGFSDNFVHSSYAYNGNDGLPWVSFLVHFGFSIFFAVLYAVLAERFPQVKLWQGAAFGVAIWIIFHIIVMPLMGVVPAPWNQLGYEFTTIPPCGVVPAPWNQPFEEHFSELFGHAVWMWAIEIFRRDLRNRITHQPDAEFALDTRTV